MSLRLRINTCMFNYLNSSNAAKKYNTASQAIREKLERDVLSTGPQRSARKGLYCTAIPDYILFVDARHRLKV